MEQLMNQYKICFRERTGYLALLATGNFGSYIFCDIWNRA